MNTEAKPLSTRFLHMNSNESQEKKERGDWKAALERSASTLLEGRIEALQKEIRRARESDSSEAMQLEMPVGLRIEPQLLPDQLRVSKGQAQT